MSEQFQKQNPIFAGPNFNSKTYIMRIQATLFLFSFQLFRNKYAFMGQWAVIFR